MNQFKETIKVKNIQGQKKPERNFYKIYERGKDGKKIYKGSIAQEGELNQDYYLAGVSCFVIDEKGNVLVEERANTKITSGELDVVSGHIDNNETPIQAVIRECVEELHGGGNKQEQETARNEAIEKLKKLEELDLIFYNKGKERRFYIQFFVLPTTLNIFTIQKGEVESLRRIPLEEFFEMMRQGKTKFPYDERFEKVFKQIKEVLKEQENSKEII